MSAGKKRFWSDDEKREICGQTRVEGASVAQVARRYAVNANLIHKWLREPRCPDQSRGFHRPDQSRQRGCFHASIKLQATSVTQRKFHAGLRRGLQGR
jgi:transposase-like protein